MVAYEVETEDLIQIRDQLALQSQHVDGTARLITGSITQLLEQTDGAVVAADASIQSLLGGLSGVVATTDVVAEAADWLGPDADSFHAANADLLSVIGLAQQRLVTAVIDHRAATISVAQALQGSVELFGAESTRLAELSGQLSAAVGAEEQSYQAAFAGGFGGDTAPGPMQPGGGDGPPPGGPGGPPAQPTEDDGWDGIGEPDLERERPEIFHYEYENGSGKQPGDPAVNIDPLAEHTFIDEHPEATFGPSAGGPFGDPDGLHGQGEFNAAKTEASVEAKAGIGLTEGAFVSASAGAGVMAGAISGKAQYGDATGHLEGYVAGAEASADGKASIGPNGAQASLKAEAFAGGKLEGEVGVEHGGVGARVGGEISYGIGGHADLDASFTADRVGVSVDVGASLGFGAGVAFDVDVNPREVLDTLDDLF